MSSQVEAQRAVEEIAHSLGYVGPEELERAGPNIRRAIGVMEGLAGHAIKT